MAEDGLLCWNCGRPTGITGTVGRSVSCDNCSSDLRCCHGCRHYDPTRRYQCKENIDSRVQIKDKSNFCDFFQMRLAIKGAGGIITIDEKEAKKNRFDDLFKD